MGLEIEYQPPRHVVPLPLCAPQTGGDNLASRRVVASWGWHRKWEECSEMSSSVHGALAELIGEVSRRDGGVRDTVSTPSSLRATPPMCSANMGRQSWGQRYGINPLVTSCHSPYVLRKHGETSCQPACGSSDRKDAWSRSEAPRNMYKATEANQV